MLPITRIRTVIQLLSLLLATVMSIGSFAQGKLEKIRVEGAALKGNLAKDDSTRDVYVYLPQDYATANKRYPVIYFLHGFGTDAKFYAATLKWPTAIDEAIAAGAAPAIVVMPDAYTIYSGSMYSNSLTTGDWEAFVAKDLVTYIDKNYRTLAKREARGLAGHSMGGYGTVRIGMKYPEVFNAFYAMSACCLLNQAPSKETVEQQIAALKADAKPIPSPVAGAPVAGAPSGFTRVTEAQAAAWAPNPQNPPYYFDWPWVNGELQPVVQAKWLANSPLVTVDQNVPALKSYKAIMIDIGDKDSLLPGNRDLDKALTRLGVAHGYEVYEGDHTNKVPERFKNNVMPFFSKHLMAK